MMDLSFWEPPNWQKESQISPLFWAAIAGVVVVMGIVIFIVSLNQKESDLNQQLTSCDATVKELEPSYQTFNDKSKLFKTIKYVILKNLRQRADQRRLSSQTMQRLFEIVPDNMVLKELSFGATSVVLNKKEKRDPKQLIQKLDYSMILSAVMTGVRSEKDVRDFANMLPSENGFGDQLLIPEITSTENSFSEKNQAMQTAFTIECIFKEK